MENFGLDLVERRTGPSNHWEAYLYVLTKSGLTVFNQLRLFLLL
jgi:hypothetical protein